VSARREVCVLVGRGGAILWADTAHHAAALPDSRARWQAIWDHRDALEDIAHSHPDGPAAFSAEDESTMRAIDSAIGRAMRYTVVAPAAVVACVAGAVTAVSPEPWWAELVRLASGMTQGERS
jgi:hypothetical protein